MHVVIPTTCSFSSLCSDCVVVLESPSSSLSMSMMPRSGRSRLEAFSRTLYRPGDSSWSTPCCCHSASFLRKSSWGTPRTPLSSSRAHVPERHHIITGKSVYSSSRSSLHSASWSWRVVGGVECVTAPHWQVHTLLSPARRNESYSN